MSREYGMPNIWPGYDPNTYPPQDTSPQYSNNNLMTQNGGNMQQYQMGGNMQQDQTNHWNSNSQIQYNVPATGYAPNTFYTAPQLTAPQYYQPQVQVQIPHPIHPHYPMNHRVPQHRIQSSSNISVGQPNSQMAHTKPAVPPLDYPQLMVSLAEEYLGAAHELAPAVAVSMMEENVHEYQKLITVGLECLTIALRQFRLPARLEAKVRLRMAGIIYEETNNYAEAESMLSQGIILCERVGHTFIFLVKYSNMRTESLRRPQICYAVPTRSINIRKESKGFDEDT